MNFPLQAFQETPAVVGASGWLVLVASLAITVGWLWHLYQ
ncbi:MAG: hypothetical protein ACI8UR_002295 [Natronomonas sp.]|jgi:hypothetical protein